MADAIWIVIARAVLGTIGVVFTCLAAFIATECATADGNVLANVGVLIADIFHTYILYREKYEQNEMSHT